TSLRVDTGSFRQHSPRLGPAGPGQVPKAQSGKIGVKATARVPLSSHTQDRERHPPPGPPSRARRARAPAGQWGGGRPQAIIGPPSRTGTRKTSMTESKVHKLVGEFATILQLAF